MSAQADPILFEAVSHPPAGLSRGGLRMLCMLVALAAAIPAVLFTLLGAWPILGFLGLEVALVLGLVCLHRRWSAAARETVMLTEARLVVRRADGRGGQEMHELEPFWARLSVEERPGTVPTLRLTSRGRQVEIGRFLSEDERRDLARALEAALRRYRDPVFDNPQLRAGGGD